MTQSLKKHFLELLLTELTKMVSLKEAKIASLAGSGIEARLWREKGVPAQNAWLIDSNPAVIRTMLKKQNQHPYHLYRGMAYTFPAVLYAHEGEAASLDLFHLDLYGGVEKSLRDVASLVPLVARSRAKLFALTVSDQRSHHATLNAGGLWRFINEVYGKRSLEILQSITQSHFESVAAQHAMIDPFSSVRREGATLLAWFCSQLGVEQGHRRLPAQALQEVRVRLAELLRGRLRVQVDQPQDVVLLHQGHAHHALELHRHHRARLTRQVSVDGRPRA